MKNKKHITLYIEKRLKNKLFYFCLLNGIDAGEFYEKVIVKKIGKG